MQRPDTEHTVVACLQLHQYAPGLGWHPLAWSGQRLQILHQMAQLQQCRELHREHPP